VSKPCCFFTKVYNTRSLYSDLFMSELYEHNRYTLEQVIQSVLHVVRLEFIQIKDCSMIVRLPFVSSSQSIFHIQ